MTRRRVTISDVAARAEVSIAAVSFALNDRPGIAAETRERILAAARELGWSPSQRARSLASSRSFAVGLVLARAPELLGLDPFYPSFIAGAEAVLSTAGYSLLLRALPDPAADPAAEAAAYRQLGTEGRVDGVLLTDLRSADSRIEVLTALGLPAITLNRPDIPSPFPAVSVEDAPGITAATEHLIQLGHTRIGHVTGPSPFLHAASRASAWRAALDAAGLPEGPVITADFTAASGAQATRDLLAMPNPPTAIVYGNDLMAIAGLSTAQAMGFTVPEQLSVTGFDNIELAAHVHPALTTVRTDPFRWGQEAARTLLKLIDTGTADDHTVGPVELIVRSSTAHPRGE